MRTLLLAAVLAGSLIVPTTAPALAFIHVTIPADNCATNAAVVPGDNETAGDAIRNVAGLTPPLGNVTNAPTTCPAP